MSDPSSLSNVDQIHSKSLHLSLKADFEKKILIGHVDVKFVIAGENTTRLILDTNHLHISSVSTQDGTQLKFNLKEPFKAFGSALEIELSSTPIDIGKEMTVRVNYSTTTQSSAIQWLDARQTAGQKHPFLFTQCQAIHARSLLPCQDSPGLKVTYTADLTVPSALTALMSAPPPANPTKANENEQTFSFNQTVPISTYLIAIVIGELERHNIGKRTQIWSEPSVIKRCAFEFEDTEKFLDTAEELAGPYRWGNYGMVVLPPSFPYGGMENPCLTFVTPTLLAGDKSLVNVVAHEIAHSWTGNLVSCKYWSDFWLNEGFTVFLERKIVGRLEGEDSRHFESILGLKHLHDDIQAFGENNPLTFLVPDLTGIDPDDSFSSCPYEKGYNFLFYLENVVGGPEVFEVFFKDYIANFAFQSLTSNDFKAYFIQYFTEKGKTAEISQIEWDKWYYTPGLSPYKNNFNDKLAVTSMKLAQSCVKDPMNINKNETTNWNAHQFMNFLDSLSALSTDGALPLTTIESIDVAFSFSQSKNAEIRFRWLLLCIKSGYDKAIDGAISFLKEQGRMKFVRPVYRALYSMEKYRQQALTTFGEHRNNYHSIAATMIAKDLKVDK